MWQGELEQEKETIIIMAKYTITLIIINRLQLNNISDGDKYNFKSQDILSYSHQKDVEYTLLSTFQAPTQT